MKLIFPILIVLLIAACSAPKQEFSLHPLFTNHMVLQQEDDVPFWGRATPGSKVTVIPGWGDPVVTTTGRDGSWILTIRTPRTGNSESVRIENGSGSVLIEDVVFGEVWLASGQSNMEMPLSGWPPNDPIDNSDMEIASAGNPHIRMFTVERATSVRPLNDVKGSWKTATPTNARVFSATAYFFARELHRELGIPVGIIHSSWGGTPAESWVALDYLPEVPGYEDIASRFDLAEEEIGYYEEWLSSLKTVDVDLQNSDHPYRAIDLGDAHLADPGHDTSGWPAMPVPSRLEDHIGHFDGAIWYRKEFSFSGDVLAEGYSLYLGPVDDIDITYLNGVRIGGTEQDGNWQVVRDYPVPPGTLVQGRNVVAVRIIDLRGGGGIYGNEAPELRENKQGLINLGGDWNYKPVAILTGRGFHLFGEGSKRYAAMPQTGIELGPATPSMLFNAMIAPLMPYTIKGAIWYQGESNVGRGMQYRTLFPAMIRSWRGNWGLGKFPFYYVQIAPYDYGETVPGATAELREAQMQALKLENTGMVVTMDIGNPANIHPANKQDVGRRLALWALARTYGRDNLVFSGPLFDRVEVVKNRAVVHFSHTGTGLYAPDETVSHFELAGPDMRYHPAKAVIDGHTVVVSSPLVAEPSAVRYAWSDKAEPNLFNREGLPAAPFRSAE
ncbi:MAG: sialate O-acetylesterase [Cyclonatronaceae bacterium]